MFYKITNYFKIINNARKLTIIEVEIAKIWFYTKYKRC